MLAMIREIETSLGHVVADAIRGEAFNVRDQGGRFSFILVDSACTPVALDRVDGISAYTTRRSVIEPEARERLSKLHEDQRRPSLHLRGVRVTGQLEWDRLTFRPQIRVDELACTTVGPIGQELQRTQAAGARSSRTLPPWPLRVMFVGSASLDACRDLERSAPGCIDLTAMDAPMMGSRVVSTLTALLGDAGPDQWDLVVIARGGGDEVSLLPFSDRRLVSAVAESRVPVLVAIGHTADHPLCQSAAACWVDTPSGAGRLLAAVVRETSSDVERLRARCGDLKSWALDRLANRRDKLTIVLASETARARRRQTGIWIGWSMLFVAVMSALLATAPSRSWGTTLAVALTVSLVGVGLPICAARIERRQGAARAPPNIHDLDGDWPVAMRTLRSLRWSRVALDARVKAIGDAIAALQPVYTSGPVNIVDPAAQHKEVEWLANQHYSDDIEWAQDMDRASRCADTLLARLAIADARPDGRRRAGDRTMPAAQ